MLTGTTTSLSIHFSLYIFFSFPLNKLQGGGVVPPPHFNTSLLPTNHDLKNSTCKFCFILLIIFFISACYLFLKGSLPNAIPPHLKLNYNNIQIMRHYCQLKEVKLSHIFLLFLYYWYE